MTISKKSFFHQTKNAMTKCKTLNICLLRIFLVLSHTTSLSEKLICLTQRENSSNRMPKTQPAHATKCLLQGKPQCLGIFLSLILLFPPSGQLVFIQSHKHDLPTFSPTRWEFVMHVTQQPKHYSTDSQIPNSSYKMYLVLLNNRGKKEIKNKR